MIVNDLENSASIGVADLVDTRLVHSQRDAIEEDDGHADSLEPRATSELKANFSFFSFFKIYNN